MPKIQYSIYELHLPTATVLRLSGFRLGLPGWASTRKIKPVWIYWNKR